ncbi:MAG: hypothetical protein JW939_04045 [Candidatus Thermoplasmatota archaeon]|nr:hypothetical protein [Candidatus Thermoplasmatota archaeon]
MFEMKRGYYRGLYLVAALYDLILGLCFLFFWKPLMEMFDIPIPSNPAYLSASAMFIFLFGVLLFLIFLKPKGSFRMVIYSVCMKIGYAAVVLYYLVTRGADFVEWPFLVFAAVDMVFAVLFIESLRFVRD